MGIQHQGPVAAYKGRTVAGADKGIVLGYRRNGADPEDGLLIAKAMVALAAKMGTGVNKWAFWVDDPEIAPKANKADKADMFAAGAAAKALEAGLALGYNVECIATRRGPKVRIGPDKPMQSKGSKPKAEGADDFLAILQKLQ